MNKLPAITATIFILLAALVTTYVYANKEVESLTEQYRKTIGTSYAELALGTVHYELEGEQHAPVVVLVHGFSVPSYVWEPTFNHLVTQGFRVLRFDIYGRGFSDRPELAYDMNTYVTQLKDLLDYLDITQPVNLVGLSMGGAVVTHFTNRYPAHVARISLLAPLVSTPSKPELMALMVPGLGKYLARVVMLPRIMNGVDKAVFDPASFSDWREKFEPQTKIKGFENAILNSARNLNGKDFSPEYTRLGKSGKPVQLIWGRNDLTLPYEQHETVLAAVKNIEFFSLDETGHLPNYERPAFVNTKLVSFLNKKTN